MEAPTVDTVADDSSGLYSGPGISLEQSEEIDPYQTSSPGNAEAENDPGTVKTDKDSEKEDQTQQPESKDKSEKELKLPLNQRNRTVSHSSPTKISPISRSLEVPTADTVADDSSELYSGSDISKEQSDKTDPCQTSAPGNAEAEKDPRTDQTDKDSEKEDHTQQTELKDTSEKDLELPLNEKTSTIADSSPTETSPSPSGSTSGQPCSRSRSNAGDRLKGESTFSDQLGKFKSIDWKKPWNMLRSKSEAPSSQSSQKRLSKSYLPTRSSKGATWTSEQVNKLETQSAKVSENIEELSREGTYRRITKEETEKLLKNYKVGTYLLRPNETCSNFVLSYVIEKDFCEHTDIIRVQLNFFQMSGKSDKLYNSIMEVIDMCRDSGFTVTLSSGSSVRAYLESPPNKFAELTQK